jgi:hypothetical protein
MDRITEVQFRQVRQTEAQAVELRRLLDSKKLTDWDQGKLRALALHAPMAEHQEATSKLQRMADKRREKAKAGKQSGDDDGFKSIVGW